MGSFKPILIAGLLATGLTACVSNVPVKPAQFNAMLSGAQEVPPVPSGATGSAAVTLDRTTNKITYTITYAGLTGPLQAIHFHGPAVAGQNAAVQVPIAVSFSPIQGSAQLTQEQASALGSGGWYVNLHTPAYPNGEIRGQLQPVR
jgi:hypothetical protein